MALAASDAGASSTASTASRRTQKPPPGSSGLPVSSAQSRGRVASANRVLWDAWYTVTVAGSRYEYYNEKVELKSGRVFYQNHVWKQEEDFLNEEQLGDVAMAGPDLVPLFYNFHSTYRSTETTVDGSVKDGKVLTVHIRKGNTELPLVRKVLPSKTILSSYFPLWLSQRLRELKPGHSLSFMTVLEDNIDLNFSTVTGSVRLLEPYAATAKAGLQKVQIDYRDLRSFWWIDRAGVPAREEIPSQKLVVVRVSEDQAKKFLDE